MSQVIFTICSSNYLAYARTLHDSLVRAGVNRPFFAFLVDEAGNLDISALPFTVIEARELAIPTFYDMAFRYNVMEFNTAVKPFCFLHLFKVVGATQAIYLDPDIFVVRPLVHIDKALAEGANLVLTPHSLAPLVDGLDPDDIRLMRTGAYNLGFAAMRAGRETEAFLSWWGKHLEDKCLVDLDNGLFVDQKFFDLAPSYLDRTVVLRHPGYNVAYWNLSGRPVTREGEEWQAGGEPLHFFHFSGVVPGDRSIFSKHQNRFTVADIGPLRELLEIYLDALDRFAMLGETKLGAVPYAYDRLTDGMPIAQEMRRVYGRRRRPHGGSKEEVFAPDLELYREPASEVGSGEVTITRLMYEVWSERADLRKSFALATPAGRAAFADWFFGTGVYEHRFAPALIRSQREMVDSTRFYATLAGGESTGKRGLGARLSWLPAAAGYRLLKPILPPETAGRLRNAALVRAGRPPIALGTRPSDKRRITRPAHIDRRLESGVGLFGYLKAESGVGEGARNARAALTAASIPHSAHALPTVAFSDSQDPGGPLTEGPTPHRVALLHINADETMRLPELMDVGGLKGRYRVGYWAWELARFPEAWMPAFDEVDEIWTPSRFVADAVAARTTKPVVVVPHPVKTPNGEAEFTRADFDIPEDRYAFLTAFDLNSFLARKNPDAAIRAFLDAFPDAGPSTPVLVVKFHGFRGRGSAFRDLVARMYEDPRIIMIDRVLTRAEMASLQRVIDCFVSLHRSEGFGLNIAECMAAGKPVIATNYSGNTDFMDEATSIPISFSMARVAPGQYPFGDGQWWAEPDHEEAVEAMRRLAGDPELGRRFGAAARARIETQYSPHAVGQRIAARVNDIEQAV